MSFDYGQKHLSELVAAEKIVAHFKVVQYDLVKLSIGKLGGFALTDNSLDMPDYGGNESIPITYVPARNTIFLSIALGWAEILDAESILIGVSAIDYSGYPDCRPKYIAAFQNLANLATKRGIEGHPIKIETPLLYLSKAETIKVGYSFGVDYSMTVYCYRANEEGLACDCCDSWELRKKDLKRLKLKTQLNILRKTNCNPTK